MPGDGGVYPGYSGERLYHLSETEVDKRGKVYKAIKNTGRVVEFKRQDERTLARWVLGILKKEGKNITEETMHAFLGRTGSDMENIERELEKLLCYTLGREVITTKDVEEICTEQTENRIFEMIQAITEKNQKKALNLYADLLEMKEPPMRILFLIARQFNQLLQLKSLSAQGMKREKWRKKQECRLLRWENTWLNAGSLHLRY